MGITLYVMPVSPPCRAVLMTVRHIGIKVDIKEENTFIGFNSNTSQLLKINPRACVPTLDDNGFYLWESRAIMGYLVNKYAPCDPIYPKDPQERALVDMMLNFDQGSIYRSQVEYLYPQVYQQELPDVNKEIPYRKALSVLNCILGANPFVAGDHLTLADLSIVANVSLAEMYNFDFRRYSNIARWLRTLKEILPYYKEINELPLIQYKFFGSAGPCSNQDGQEYENHTKL